MYFPLLPFYSALMFSQLISVHNSRSHHFYSFFGEKAAQLNHGDKIVREGSNTGPRKSHQKFTVSVFFFFATLYFVFYTLLIFSRLFFFFATFFTLPLFFFHDFFSRLCFRDFVLHSPTFFFATLTVGSEPESRSTFEKWRRQHHRPRRQPHKMQ